VIVRVECGGREAGFSTAPFAKCANASDQNDNSNGGWVGLLCEEVEVDGVGHGFVTCVVGVEMIS
jgi:hypothetical protein